MKHRLFFILIAILAATTVAVALAPKPPGSGKETQGKNRSFRSNGSKGRSSRDKSKSRYRNGSNLKGYGPGSDHKYDTKTNDNSIVDSQHPEISLPEIEMVFVEGGTFRMGSDDGFDEGPVHEVSISSFYIGKYEVTQKLWFAVMGNNPSEFKGDELPVENVTWYAAQEFIRKLNERTGKHYRLPTEAEWEFAARGGRRSRGYKYSGSNDLGAVAWYDSNSGKQTHIVGTKLPNELFIYDMLGNVLEWCHDWHDSWYYRESPYSNPAGPAEGDERVCRGGGAGCSAKYVSLTKRYDIGPRCGSGVSWSNGIRNDLNLGLRLAL